MSDLWDLVHKASELRIAGREESRLRRQAEAECDELREKVEYNAPKLGYVLGGNRMAEAIHTLVFLHLIDSRSEAADAALDWELPDRRKQSLIDELREKVEAVHGFALDGDLDRVLALANTAGAEAGGGDDAAVTTWWSVVVREWKVYTGEATREATHDPTP